MSYSTFYYLSKRVPKSLELMLSETISIFLTIAGDTGKNLKIIIAE